MNYFPFHISDFYLHAGHLTPEEEGVYHRLLNYYYDTESPIPDNQEKTQWVIRRLRLKGYEEIFHAILSEFFILEADGWHNPRADKEISDYRAKAERARKNGKAGGRPKKNNDLQIEKPTITQPVILAIPAETGSQANQEPITKNQEPDLKDIHREAAGRVIAYLNVKAGKKYKISDANRTPIIARLKEGFIEDDCLRVIDNRCNRWLGTEQAQYLRPDTLFRPSKFESYLNDTGEINAEIRLNQSPGASRQSKSDAIREATFSDNW